MTDPENGERPEEDPELNSNQLKRRWIFILVPLCLAILLYNAFGISLRIDDDIATILGRAFGSSLVFFLIFYFLYAKKVGQNAPLISFFAILISSGIDLFVANNRLHSNYGASLGKLDDNILSSVDSNKEISSIDSEQNIAYPNKKEQLRLINEMMAKVSSLQHEYEQELKTIGWKDIMDPIRLKKDKKFIDSKTRIEKALNAVHTVRRKFDTLIDGMELEINSLKISEDAKKAILAGYRSSTNNPSRDSLWILEENIIFDVKKIVDYLSIREWIVAGNDIAFKRNGDGEKYNSYISDIQEQTEKENSLQQSRASHLKEELNELKKQ